jgi:hypothetical protein
MRINKKINCKTLVFNLYIIFKSWNNIITREEEEEKKKSIIIIMCVDVCENLIMFIIYI